MVSSQDVFAFIVVLDVGWWLLPQCGAGLFCTDVPTDPGAVVQMQSTSWAGAGGEGVAIRGRPHSPQVLAGLLPPRAPACAAAWWNTHDDSLLVESCLEPGE